MKGTRRLWFLTAIIPILLLTGVAFICSYKDGEFTYFGLSASLKSIADVPDSGISLDNFRNRMGLAARHQFTLNGPDGIYTLANCFFRRDYDEFFYLFRDKTLTKVVSARALTRLGDPAPTEDEETVRSIDAIMRAPPVSHQEVLDELKPKPEYPSDNELPALLVIPLGAAALVHLGPDLLNIAPHVLVTRRLIARYSGFKVDLGMNEADVRRLYGKPSNTFHSSQGGIVYVYYNNSKDNSSDDDSNSQLTFYGMAVVLSPSGIVTECLSDNFFNPEWKKKK